MSVQATPEAPHLRTASTVDTELIFSVLMRMTATSPAPQMKLVVPAVAYRHLHAARQEGKLFVYGDYAILVDVGAPWHTDKLVLIEDIIVRFRREHGNPVEGAVAQLDVIAKSFKCVAIAAGDTQVGIMSPRYLAAGFQVLGTQFYKEQADGLHS